MGNTDLCDVAQDLQVTMKDCESKSSINLTEIIYLLFMMQFFGVQFKYIKTNLVLILVLILGFIFKLKEFSFNLMLILYLLFKL